MKKTTLFFSACLLYCQAFLSAQNVGIGTASPDASAKLEIADNGRGLLIPRMTAAQKTAISSPATGLLIYQTDGTNGFWYFNGTIWVYISAVVSNDWSLLGNTGTNPATNFIGTTDNQPLIFRTNNAARARISTKGQIEPLNTGGSVFVGEGAGQNDDLSANNNVFVGFQTGQTNTIGARNTFVGYQSGTSNLSGANNTAVGESTMFTNTVGNSNTAIGQRALVSNIASSNNVAIGLSALETQSFNNGGVAWNTNNTAIGSGALFSNQPTSTSDAVNNTAVGASALRNNTTGRANSAVGVNSLLNTNTGLRNTALGLSAGDINTTGNNNTFIGVAANASVNNLDNATAIGQGAVVDASNKVRVGNNAVTETDIAGVLTYNAQSATTSITFPNGRGTNGQVLATNGAGLTSWATLPASGTTETASNGLTKTGNDIQLGGDLTASTVITQDATEQFRINNNSTVGTVIDLQNTGDFRILDAGVSALQVLDNGTLAVGTTNQFQIDNTGDITRLNNVVTSFPAAQGAANSFLRNDGAGNLTWNSITGESTTANNGLTLTGNNLALGGNLVANTLITQTAAQTLSFANNSTANTIFNLQNTGDFIVQNAGVNALQVLDDGRILAGTTGQFVVNNTGNVVRLNNVVTNFPATQGAANTVLTNDGAGNLSWTAPTAAGSNNSWNLLGNAATNPSTNFVGTTDDISLSFRVNNQRAGLISNSAGSNTFLGYSSGLSNSTGAGNSGFGQNALSLNTTGGANTAIGNEAMSSNSIGRRNTALGNFALVNSVNSNENVAIGESALLVYNFNNGGVAMDGINTAVGRNALLILNSTNSSNGIRNTALGGYAGFNTQNCTDCTFLGAYAAVNNSATIYTNATAIGANTIIDASNKVRVGNNAVTETDLAGQLTYNAQSATTSNTFPNNRGANGQVLTSNGAGLLSWTNGNAFNWGTSGNTGTVYGTNYLGNNDDVGLEFRVNGSRAGWVGSSSNYSTYLGYQAGVNNVPSSAGDGNTGIGRFALFSNTSGGANVAIGQNTLLLNSSGNFNTALGVSSLNRNTTGSMTVAIGADAMNVFTFNNGGSNWNTHNVAIGKSSLQMLDATSNANGLANTAIGSYSGASVTTASYSTFVGQFSNASFGTVTNAVALGANCSVDANNRVRLGGAGTTSVGGPVAYTNFSDARFKHNVQNNVKGLEFIQRLNPVTYQFDYSKLNDFYHLDKENLKNVDMNPANAMIQTGFMAEEVEALCKEMNFEFGAVDKPDNNNEGIYGIRYTAFVPVLVKAMQEQQSQIENQTAKIETQQQQILQLQSDLNELKQMLRADNK